MKTGPVRAELPFGALAEKLRPRALPRARMPSMPNTHGSARRASAPEIVSFALDAEGLEDGVRRELDALPSARLDLFVSPERAAVGGGVIDEVRFDCEREELREGSSSSEVLELLEATLEFLEAPPTPPRVMGIVNTTPDSFYDGGRHLDPGRATEHGLELEAEGADILDVGGESTRPGARPVSTEEELARVIPVIEALSRSAKAEISVDTTKAEVARAALDAGASIVNDVSAGASDPAMLPLVADRGPTYVAMHMQGTPGTMQDDPAYGDVVADVVRVLRERTSACLKAGVDIHKIVLDPGIGFGKTLRHNLSLLQRLPEFRSLGRPLLLGVSRKSFIARALGPDRSASSPTPSAPIDPSDRLGGTAAAVTVCVLGGAEILRVHDVGIMSQVIRMAWAIAHPDMPTFESA